MKKIVLIDTTGPGQPREVGTVEFLKDPVKTDVDLKCSGKTITVDQANKILVQMKPTDKHGGAVVGDVSGVTGLKWRT